MKLSDLKTSDELLQEELKDPAFRAEWERTAVARAIAVEVVAYRADHDLSQRALAKKLGMKQPQVSRLEQGDITPTIETLARISQRLGIEIALDFHPAGREPRLLSRRAKTSDMVLAYDSGEAALAIAAA